jgi:hypothetical protein
MLHPPRPGARYPPALEDVTMSSQPNEPNPQDDSSFEPSRSSTSRPEPATENRSDFDERFESDSQFSTKHGDDEDHVERVETSIRVLYTLLFFLIFQVIEAAAGVIIFFQIVFALITNRTPNPAVTDFARRVIEYGYQIGHYLTYNREKPPFPFDELPE